MEYVWGPGKTKGSQSWTLTFRNTESMKYKVDLLKNNYPPNIPGLLIIETQILFQYRIPKKFLLLTRFEKFSLFND